MPSRLEGAAPVFVVRDVLYGEPGQMAINIFVSDVDALYEELKGRGAKLLNAPKDYAYGMRDFNKALNRLPDGNRTQIRKKRTGA